MLKNYIHCTVPCIKKIITEVENKYMIMVSTYNSSKLVGGMVTILFLSQNWLHFKQVSFV